MPRRAGTDAKPIAEPATRVPLAADADVVVVGAGPGGFAAALKAARMVGRMLEEAGVQTFYGTSFVDVAIKRGSREDAITAVIVENASGRQAITGKGFIDGSGTAEGGARGGAPP